MNKSLFKKNVLCSECGNLMPFAGQSKEEEQAGVWLCSDCRRSMRGGSIGGPESPRMSDDMLDTKSIHLYPGSRSACRLGRWGYAEEKR